MVYKKSRRDKWCCSWCSLAHEDYKVVIEHENNEHGGKKE